MPFGGWACSYQTNIPNYSKMAIKVIYIDLFCGAGGTSTGVHFARHAGDPCAKVIACVNHDANAIASHAANHPDALHYTEDIRTLELGPLAAHAARMRRQYPDAFVVLWASLECTNFSRAKGGLPRDADSRTLAEHLFRYIEALNPDYIQIENVEEFMSWGDLDERGKPVSRDAGRLYRKWIDNVRGYGYDFGHRILNAADFGAYTSRRRFFGIFARRGLPIVFPKPTHTKNPAQGDLFGQQLRKWRPVREVLDLEDEGESIFDRKRPLVEASLARIHAGLVKFVAGGREAFLVKYNSMNQSGKYVAPGIDEPCPTVATQNRLGVAKVYYLCKHFGGSPEGKCTAVDAPAGAITCRDHHAFVSAYYGNGFNSSIERPSPTVTTKDRFQLVRPFFANYYSGGGQTAGTDGPAPAVMTNPKQRLVTPWIMNTNFSNVGSSLDAPAQTVTANRKWQYLMNPQFASAGRYRSAVFHADRPHGQAAAAAGDGRSGRRGAALVHQAGGRNVGLRDLPGRYADAGADKGVHGAVRTGGHPDADASYPGTEADHGLPGELRTDRHAGRAEKIYRQRRRSEHGTGSLRGAGGETLRVEHRAAAVCGVIYTTNEIKQQKL